MTAAAVLALGTIECQMATDPMLDDRKAAILRAVVEEYIETALPVGSSHVARAQGVDVSSATVRNEMALLEQEGYLEQPHTSAGRIPTDKGYRFFVNQLEVEPALDRSRRQQVTSFFARTHGELQTMLNDTSRLLANLTDYAALVVAPHTEGAAVRSVQLVGISERLAVLVLVLADGHVDKHTIELPEGFDDGRLAAATVKLSEALVGSSTVAGWAPLASGDELLDELLARCQAALGTHPVGESEEVFVGGAARMAGSFEAVETLRQVLSILEEQLVVVSLVHDVLSRGLNVAIGSETGLQHLSECSVVVAPYEVEGEPVGAVGVLGPTRMHYPEALAAVAVVSRRLSDHLSEGSP